LPPSSVPKSILPSFSKSTVSTQPSPTLSLSSKPHTITSLPSSSPPESNILSPTLSLSSKPHTITSLPSSSHPESNILSEKQPLPTFSLPSEPLPPNPFPLFLPHLHFIGLKLSTLIAGKMLELLEQRRGQTRTPLPKL
ncbi:Calpain-B, partial [Frankliniella fusca]